MPEFREDEKHKESHRKIHAGLDKTNALLTTFERNPKSYDAQALRDALDSFREPLYTHLAEEV